MKSAVSETKEKPDALQLAGQQANDALARGGISQSQYDALQREIVETGKTVWNGLSSFFTSCWQGIQGMFTAVLTGIQTVLSTVWNAIKNVVTAVVGAIQAFITAAWNGIKSAVSNVFNRAVSGIRTAMGNVYNSIVSGFNKAVGFITGLGSSAFRYMWQVRCGSFRCRMTFCGMSGIMGENEPGAGADYGYI